MEEKLLVPHSDQGQIPPEDLLSTSQEYLGDCLCKASCSSEFALFKKIVLSSQQGPQSYSSRRWSY